MAQLFDYIVDSLEEYKYADDRSVALIGEIGYSGTLENLVAELDDGLNSRSIEFNGETLFAENALKCMILHPPRIIRSLVDYKTELDDKGKETTSAEELLRIAIKIGLDIYSLERFSASMELKAMAKEITKEHKDLWISRVHQSHELDTCCAMHSSYTRKCAYKMAQQANKGNILFISIGHGGTASGMDTFLKYSEICKPSDSHFYVARYSKRHKDGQPRLSETERNFLREKSSGKQIIIYDDVKSSGLTLEYAKKYFVENIFPGAKIDTFYSYAARDVLSTDG